MKRLLVSSVVAGTIALIGTNGAKSIFASGIDRPFGMVHNPQDNCLYVPRYGGGLSRVSSDGLVFDVPLSEPLDGPNGITIGPDGTLYAACYDKGDPGKGRVVAISSSGQVSTIVDGLTGPGGILYHNGALYVTCFASPKNGALLWKIGLDGSVTTLITNKNSCPWDLCEVSGKLYIANNMNGQIGSCALTGSVMANVVTSVKLRGAMGIAADGSNLIIANMNTGTVYSMPAAGGQLTEVATALEYPTDVMVCPESF